jgi:hypothetical protein
VANRCAAGPFQRFALWYEVVGAANSPDGLPGVGWVYRAASGLATVIEITARFRRQLGAVQVVGLSCVAHRPCANALAIKAPFPAASRVVMTHRLSPHDLRLSFGDAFPVLAAWSRSLPVPVPKHQAAEIDSKLPLLGIPKIAPPSYQSVRPLPVRLAKKTPLRRDAATRRARSVRVVSHDLDGLSRTGPADLLHPATDLGVRHVSSGRRLVLATVASDGNQCLRANHRSQWRYALRSVPLVSSSCRVTATDAFTPFSHADSLIASDASAGALQCLRGRFDLKALFH